MRTLRVALVAVMLTAVVFAGCTPRGVFVRQYEPAPAYVPAPPPGAVYAPAPAYVPAPPPPAPVAAPLPQTQADVEVQTRGPVHEAFAEPVVYAAQTTIVVPRAPPPPIQELPPADRPADPRIVWVPGYWSWDDDRADFLWVSGCWRFPPPGCSWVPGYWTQVAGGFQWVEGLWLAAPANEIVYLPSPPASIEAGPVGMPASDNFIWVPGYWAWNGLQFVWMAGHWAVAQPDWVWMPAHYIVTPRGCIFVAGYWDYMIARRGILFAPCYFWRGVYLRAGFYYSPDVVIDLDIILSNLFARPRYGHYYFGDYYDARYAALGIHPWFEFHQQHRWYDPIAVHEAWRRQHDDPMWERREHERFDHLQAETAARPAHTFAAQQAQIARLPRPARQAAEIAQPLSQVVDRPPSQMQFEKINDQQRRQLEQQAQEVHKYKETRAKWEAPPAAAKPGAKPSAAVASPTPVAPAFALPTAAKQPQATAAPPARTAMPQAEVRQPPGAFVPPTAVRRPETTVAQPAATPPVIAPRTAAPAVTAPPPLVAAPKEVRPPLAPPTEIRRLAPPPKEVRAPAAPAAPVGPVAPPTTGRRPEEIRQPLAPEKVSIPKSPITGKPPEARQPLPPRPQPPQAEPPKVQQPEPRRESPRAVAPAQPRVEQPEAKKDKEDGRK